SRRPAGSKLSRPGSRSATNFLFFLVPGSIPRARPPGRDVCDQSAGHGGGHDAGIVATGFSRCSQHFACRWIHQGCHVWRQFARGALVDAIHPGALGVQISPWGQMMEDGITGLTQIGGIPTGMTEGLELARAHRRRGPSAYMLLLILRVEYADL